MPTRSEMITIDLGVKGVVSAVIAGPANKADSTGVGLILAHGAGNDMNNALIVAVAHALAAAGYPTLRFNFPYKEKGKKSPDAQATLIHTWRCVHAYMQANQQFPVKRTVAVGKSMGGRVASQMVAAKEMNVAALIFLGYPLHAPGRSDQLRDAHLYAIDVPMLFFSGTRDALCKLEKLDDVLKQVASPHHLEIIEGGDHSFRLTKASDRSPTDVHDQIVSRCVAGLERLRAEVG